MREMGLNSLQARPLLLEFTFGTHAGGTFCFIHVAGGQQSSWPPLGALFETRA